MVAPNILNAFGDSTDTYTGYNTKPNVLKIPTGATGYDTGYWSDPLQNSSKCGFTIEVMAPPYAIMRETNAPLMDVKYKAGLAANEDYMTYEEAQAVTDAKKIADAIKQVGSISFNEFRYFTGITSLSNSCFDNCTSLTSIKLPNSVTSIGDNCFAGCTSLTSITLSENLTSIGNSNNHSDCFAGCTSLVSIEIPDSVTFIGSGCFYNCTSLTSITLSKNVTSLGDSFFYSCSSLASIELPSSITTLSTYCFAYCTNLTSITCLATTAPSVSVSTFGKYSVQFTGLNTYNKGINKLKVPTGATGYDTSYWLDPLQKSTKCGFTIEYI